MKTTTTTTTFCIYFSNQFYLFIYLFVIFAPIFFKFTTVVYRSLYKIPSPYHLVHWSVLSSYLPSFFSFFLIYFFSSDFHSLLFKFVCLFISFFQINSPKCFFPFLFFFQLFSPINGIPSDGKTEERNAKKSGNKKMKKNFKKEKQNIP